MKKEELIEKAAVEITEKKHRRIFSNASIPAYFRELSIVIIGVLITLLITNTISNYTRQKEINRILKFIKTELEENLENVEWEQNRWEGEQYMFRLIQENLDNLNQIPPDTLNKYHYVRGSIYNFTIKSESYELLKTAMLIQYVKDKDLLRRLSATYGMLQTLKNQLSNYTTQKRALFLDPIMTSMNQKEMEKLTSKNSYDSFAYICGKEEFVKFVFIGGTILSPTTIFDDCKQLIKETQRKF